ncbi:MAG: cupin domain-containing protein [Actinomycetes bacterium]
MTTSTVGRWVGTAGVALVALALLTACGGGSSDAASSSSSVAPSSTAGANTQSLLTKQQLTVLDQPITYPAKKPAQVSSEIISLEPGQETGWQKHKAPMFAYVLEGTLTVEYDAGVVKEFPAGTALMDAQNVWHNGTNKGDSPVRVLVVNMGAKGVKNTIERTP